MKKIAYFLLIFFWILSSYATPVDNASIRLTVKFAWQEPDAPFNIQPIHQTQTLILDTVKPIYSIVMTRTVVMDHQSPVTLALLVKPQILSQDEIELQFELVKYGFPRVPSSQNMTSVITQPKFIVKNNQTANVVVNPENGLMLEVMAARMGT